MSDKTDDIAVALFGELFMADQLARNRISKVLPKGMELSHFSVLNHLARIGDEAVIGLYHAGPYEAPAGGYARFFHEAGHTIALPWFADRAAPMRFRQWDNPHVDDLLEAEEETSADEPRGDEPAQ